MDDALGVDRLERPDEPARELDERFALERTVRCDSVIEGVAVDEPRHEVGPRPVDVGVDDRSHPRVTDAGEAVDLTLEAGSRLVVVGDVGAQHLDRDRPAVGVEGEVDDAHAALADPLDQAIGTEPFGEPLGGRDRALVRAPLTVLTVLTALTALPTLTARRASARDVIVGR